ncbi:hypothetical protein GC508_03865 [Corynebacterium sp. zg910]|nr:hypothetical protein [Corynebacterium lujinxingii]
MSRSQVRRRRIEAITPQDPTSKLTNTHYPCVASRADEKVMAVAKNSKQISRRVARKASDALRDCHSSARTKYLAGSAF